MAKQNVELRFSLKDGVSSGLKSIQTSVAGIGTTIAKIGPAAIAAGAALATVGIGAALTKGVSDAADFESALGRISVKSGETGAALANVKTNIETIGAASSKSVGESAAAFEMLAAEGFSTADAINALPAALNLATVAGISTKEAASALAATLDQFGLSASAASVTADQLATAAKAGGTGVGEMLAALDQAGTAARNAGLSFEQTSAALAAMAQSGIEGGRAGGALRAILDGLADPASKFSQELSKIGITSRDFGTVVDQLGAKGTAASAAFNSLGSKGTTALIAMSRDGGAAMGQLRDKIGDAEGTLASFADTINSDFNGAMLRLQQAYNDTQRTFFEPLLGPLAIELDALAEKIREFAASEDFAKLRTEFTEAFTAGIEGVKNFIAEFDFDSAKSSLSKFLTSAKTELDNFAKSAREVADAVKTIHEIIALAANTFDAGVSSIAAAVFKLGEVTSKPLALMSDAGEEVERVFAGLADGALERTIVQADEMGENFLNLTDGIRHTADETEHVAASVIKFEGKLLTLAEVTKILADRNAEAAKAQIALRGTFDETAKAATASVGAMGNAGEAVKALHADIAASQEALKQAILSGADDATIEAFKTKIGDARAQLQLLALAGVDVGTKTAQGATKAAQSLDQIGSSAANAADDVEKVDAATQQSATMAAEGTASLSGILAALFSKYSGLSKAAGEFFAATQKAANVGSLSLADYGASIVAADKATQAAFDNQVVGASNAIAKLEEFARTGKVAGESTATAFFESEAALDSMGAALRDGVGGFELLDSQTLSKLQSSLDAARQKTKQLAADARAAADELAAIGDQLEDQALRDSGNEEAIARRELDRKIANIEEIAKRAGDAGAANAERARRLAQEEFARAVAAINERKAAEAAAARETADTRIAENQRVHDADPYNQTAAASGVASGGIGTSLQRGQESSQTINITVDRLQSVGGSKRDIEELVRLLKPEFDRLSRRTR